MRFLNRKFSLLFISPFLFFLLSFDLTGSWYKSGTKTSSYVMDDLAGAGLGGRNAFTIRSIEPVTDGFAMILHDNTPGVFLGKRVRMRANMKTSNVKGWAGLYLRVDKSGQGQAVVMDNMHDRSVKGTTGWKKYELVVDVPKTASKIIYGGMLSGSGEIWFDNPVLEEVGADVPVTAQPNPAPVKKQ